MKKKNKPIKKSLGRKGEKLAEKHLKSKGYKILSRNFRSHFGEIDIIAVKRNKLVFFEVKTRWSRKFGSPESAITPLKIKRMIKTAYYFHQKNSYLPESFRLDAVARCVC